MIVQILVLSLISGGSAFSPSPNVVPRLSTRLLSTKASFNITGTLPLEEYDRQLFEQMQVQTKNQVKILESGSSVTMQQLQSMEEEIMQALEKLRQRKQQDEGENQKQYDSLSQEYKDFQKDSRKQQAKLKEKVQSTQDRLNAELLYLRTQLSEAEERTSQEEQRYKSMEQEKLELERKLLQFKQDATTEMEALTSQHQQELQHSQQELKEVQVSLQKLQEAREQDCLKDRRNEALDQQIRECAEVTRSLARELLPTKRATADYDLFDKSRQIAALKESNEKLTRVASQLQELAKFKAETGVEATDGSLGLSQVAEKISDIVKRYRTKEVEYQKSVRKLERTLSLTRRSLEDQLQSVAADYQKLQSKTARQQQRERQDASRRQESLQNEIGKLNGILQEQSTLLVHERSRSKAQEKLLVDTKVRLKDIQQSSQSRIGQLSSLYEKEQEKRTRDQASRLSGLVIATLSTALLVSALPILLGIDIEGSTKRQEATIYLDSVKERTSSELSSLKNRVPSVPLVSMPSVDSSRITKGVNKYMEQVTNEYGTEMVFSAPFRGRVGASPAAQAPRPSTTGATVVEESVKSATSLPTEATKSLDQAQPSLKPEAQGAVVAPGPIETKERAPTASTPPVSSKLQEITKDVESTPKEALSQSTSSSEMAMSTEKESATAAKPKPVVSAKDFTKAFESTNVVERLTTATKIDEKVASSDDNYIDWDKYEEYWLDVVRERLTEAAKNQSP